VDRQPRKKKAAERGMIEHLDNIRRAGLKRLLLHRRVATKIDVHCKVEDILGERVRWTNKALGERLQVKWEEVKQLHLKGMTPVNVSKETVALYYLERRRERDRRRAKKMRAQMKVTNGLSARARKLAALLNGDWMPLYSLVETVEDSWRLKHDAAGRAVRRAALELREAEIGFEVKVEPGPRGGYVQFVRRSPSITGISENRGARSADKIRAARKGDSNLSRRTKSVGQNRVAFPKKCRKIAHKSMLTVH
jgi:hypothetical protein